MDSCYCTFLKKISMYVFINVKNKTKTYLKNKTWGLPWWSSGWDFAYQCRGRRFHSWSGKISHAMGQLSPCTTTTDTSVPRAHVPQEQPLQWEAHTLQPESSRRLRQLEKACAQQGRPSAAPRTNKQKHNDVNGTNLQGQRESKGTVARWYSSLETSFEKWKWMKG